MSQTLSSRDQPRYLLILLKYDAVTTFERYCDASSRIFRMFKDQNGIWSVDKLIDSANASRKDVSTTITMVVLETLTTKGLIPRLNTWIGPHYGMKSIGQDPASVDKRVKTVIRTAPVRRNDFMAAWEFVYAILLGALRTEGKQFLRLAVARSTDKLLDVVQDWAEDGICEDIPERRPSTSERSVGKSTCWSLAPTAITDLLEAVGGPSERLPDAEPDSCSYGSLSSVGGDLADQAGFTQNLRGLIGDRERKRDTAEDKLARLLEAERLERAELEARLSTFSFSTPGGVESFSRRGFFRRGSIASSTTSSGPPSVFDEEGGDASSRRSSISSQGSVDLPGSIPERSSSMTTLDDDDWRKADWRSACDDNPDVPAGYVSRYWIVRVTHYPPSYQLLI